MKIVRGETDRVRLREHGRRRCTFVSIAQPTEYDLVYTPEEIEEICLCARDGDTFVLMDGSRPFFAAAKNGGGEAVLAFKREIAEKVPSLLAGMNLDLSGRVSSPLFFPVGAFHPFRQDDRLKCFEKVAVGHPGDEVPHLLAVARRLQIVRGDPGGVEVVGVDEGTGLLFLQVGGERCRRCGSARRANKQEKSCDDQA